MFLVFLVLLRTVDIPYHHKRILIAPLCWGLGHATRCIPIIDRLLAQGCEVAIASDSEALTYLRAEYPELQSFELPSYGIKYSYRSMVINMLVQAPQILTAVKEERQVAEKINLTWKPDAIISDNRLGFRSTSVESVYLTHQLQVQGGSAIGTGVATRLHRYYHQQFDKIWVPDSEGDSSLAGTLSRKPSQNIDVTYLGPLSRFRQLDLMKDIDILVILSGPEPQRTQLEKRLLPVLSTVSTDYSIEIVRGTASVDPPPYPKQIRKSDLMQSEELNERISRSTLVICRAGYSSIMDLASLDMGALLIPTPGQYEQLYLGQYLDGKHGFECIPQHSVETRLVSRIESRLTH